MRSPSAKGRQAAGRPRRMFRFVVILRHSTPTTLREYYRKKDQSWSIYNIMAAPPLPSKERYPTDSLTLSHRGRGDQQPPCTPATSRCGARLQRCARNDSIGPLRRESPPASSSRAFLFLSLRGAQRRGNPLPEPTPLPVTVQTCGDLRAIRPLTEGQPSTEFALQADSSPQT